MFCIIFHFSAANVLMDDMCLHIKLADFGSCVDLTSLETLSVQSSSLNGTLAFMAPEVDKDGRVYRFNKLKINCQGLCLNYLKKIS